MTVTELRQPAPDQIGSPEQALRVYLLDPSTAVAESAYALGYLDGYLTGVRYSYGLQTDTDVAARDRFYGPESWQYQPHRLDVALRRTVAVTNPAKRLAMLSGAGWLEGFSDATVGADDASWCSVCTRRLLLEIDVDNGYAYRCAQDGEDLCRWHTDDCNSHLACSDD